MVLEWDTFSIIVVKYRAQIAFQVGMGFCTQSKMHHSRHNKNAIPSSSPCYRKRQHLVGAGQSPITEWPNCSVEPEPSLKGQMRRGDQNENYRQNERAQRQGNSRRAAETHTSTGTCINTTKRAMLICMPGCVNRHHF